MRPFETVLVKELLCIIYEDFDWNLGTCYIYTCTCIVLVLLSRKISIYLCRHPSATFQNHRPVNFIKTLLTQILQVFSVMKSCSVILSYTKYNCLLNYSYMYIPVQVPYSMYIIIFVYKMILPYPITVELTDILIGGRVMFKSQRSVLCLHFENNAI
jgi:hypothetical protein